MILFNTEKYFLVIKLLSMFTMLKYETNFKEYMNTTKYDFSFESFLEKTSRTSGEYGTELNIISIALMLKRNILCYNESIRPNLSNRLKFKIFDLDDPPIILGLAEVHYFPIFDSGQIFVDQLMIKETILELEYIFH